MTGSFLLFHGFYFDFFRFSYCVSNLFLDWSVALPANKVSKWSQGFKALEAWMKARQIFYQFI